MVALQKPFFAPETAPDIGASHCSSRFVSLGPIGTGRRRPWTEGNDVVGKVTLAFRSQRELRKKAWKAASP